MICDDFNMNKYNIIYVYCINAMYKMHSLISLYQILLSQLRLVLPYFMQVANYIQNICYLHKICYRYIPNFNNRLSYANQYTSIYPTISFNIILKLSPEGILFEPATSDLGWNSYPDRTYHIIALMEVIIECLSL